jgi:CheY-like chemotaxis protein
VHPKKLPLNKVLDYVYATFHPLTVDRGLGFEIVVGDDVPRELFSDEQRLQQILRNLLSNAVKFTSSGEVELRVERVPATDFEEETLKNAEAVIAFSVKDTGIGILPEKLPVIFEAFQQSDGTTNRKYGGTGLGLSISREIAGMLGGRIVAESEVGVGSCFTLYIPLRYPGVLPPPSLPTMAATAQAVLPAQPTALRGTADGGQSDVFDIAESLHPVPASLIARGMPAIADGRDDTWPETTRLKEWLSGRPGRVLAGCHILIVDDDIRNVFALTHVLGRVGITVKYAENGREGLEVLQRSPDVSLVLMDIMMPEMDGYETISAIRATPRLAHLPIIALTAKAMPGDRDKAMDSGASEYVPKPVDIDRLLSVICGLLDPQDGLSAPDPDTTDGTHGTEGDDENPPRQRP